MTEITKRRTIAQIYSVNNDNSSSQKSIQKQDIYLFKGMLLLFCLFTHHRNLLGIVCFLSSTLTSNIGGSTDVKRNCIEMLVDFNQMFIALHIRNFRINF